MCHCQLCKVGMSNSAIRIKSPFVNGGSASRSTPISSRNKANGLLLSPSIDRLFDRGFISFSDDGELLISPVAERSEIAKLGVPTEDVCDVGAFSERQREYLAYHRDNVFRAP